MALPEPPRTASPAPALSVIIPAHNRADLILQTLTSLADQSLPADLYEVIVIDDGSTDRTPEVVADLAQGGGRIRLLRRAANLGPGAARNEGVREAAGEILVFVDSDVVVRPDFLAHHLDAHRRAQRAIICRGPVVPVSDLAVPAAPARRLPLAALSPLYFDSANASLPRSELLGAGLFDERFGTYGWEDIDLGFRLQRRGLARIFRRDAVAYHLQPAPSARSFERMLAKEERRARAAVYLYQKHPSWSTNWLIQRTRIHRVIYFLVAGAGLLNGRTAPVLASRFRRSGRITLEYLVQRAPLNRHYLATLQREWAAPPLPAAAAEATGPAISVVIPAHNSASLLPDTLSALSTQGGAFEIIVVDDGSTDGTAEMAEGLRLRAPLRVLRQPQRGRAAARNLGAAVAAAPVLLFIDADMRPQPGLIEAHLRHYRDGARVGVQGRTLQHPSTLTTTFMRATNLLPDLTVRRREDLSPTHIITRNFSVAAAPFREVGGFDEAFAGYGWEDIELGLRLRQAGVRLRFEPDALAYHHHRQSLEELEPKLRQAGAGAVYFWEKHARPTWLGLFLEIHPALLPLKWLVYRSGVVTPIMRALRPFAERRAILPLCSEIYNHLLWRAFYEGVFLARRPTAVSEQPVPRMGATRLLSVSNGHGEDLIASEILRNLGGLEVTAFPLVGLGDAYPADLLRLEPRRSFPSGGFAFRHGQPSLLDDLRAGFIRFWFAQRAVLRAQRGRFDLTLAVGDAYCLLMATLAGAPAVLVASADSIHNGPYGPLHLWVLRRAVRVFARDAETADWLAARGIPSTYLGNVMLDCLRPDGTDFDLPPGRPIVALLPGSRGDAPGNAAPLAEVAAAVARARPETLFLLSLAPTVNAEEMAQALRAAGGRSDNGESVLGHARIRMTRAFADAITHATVVVGMAGTANEQAAGLGKPVVAFPGPGVQFTPGFLSLQRKILGEALVAAPTAEKAAEAVVRLLSDPEERTRRGRAGRERMGEPGAGGRIARDLQAIAAALPTAGRR